MEEGKRGRITAKYDDFAQIRTEDNKKEAFLKENAKEWEEMIAGSLVRIEEDGSVTLLKRYYKGESPLLIRTVANRRMQFDLEDIESFGCENVLDTLNPVPDMEEVAKKGYKRSDFECVYIKIHGEDEPYRFFGIDGSYYGGIGKVTSLPGLMRYIKSEIALL